MLYMATVENRLSIVDISDTEKVFKKATIKLDSVLHHLTYRQWDI